MGMEMASSPRRTVTLTRGFVYESIHACVFCGAKRYQYLGMRVLRDTPPEQVPVYLFGCTHCHSTRTMTNAGGAA